MKAPAPAGRGPRPGENDARTRPLRLLDDEGLPGRLAVSPAEAAAALGISRSHFDSVVLPDLHVVYCGARRLIPVRELISYLERNATRT